VPHTCKNEISKHEWQLAPNINGSKNLQVNKYQFVNIFTSSKFG